MCLGRRPAGQTRGWPGALEEALEEEPWSGRRALEETLEEALQEEEALEPWRPGALEGLPVVAHLGHCVRTVRLPPLSCSDTGPELHHRPRACPVLSCTFSTKALPATVATVTVPRLPPPHRRPVDYFSPFHPGCRNPSHCRAGLRRFEHEPRH